jgi:hypothetical protein
MAYTYYRLLPPVGGATTTVNGRTFSAADGVPIDVYGLSDIQELVGHGWGVTINAPCGATGARTANPINGEEFLDTTLGYVIVFNAARKAWLNPATGAAV